LDKLKKIAACLLFATSFSFGCDIKWQNSIATAKRLSQAERKPIMVFVTSPTCPYCTIMSEATLKDEEVCELINSKFIPLVAIDGSKDVPKNSKVLGVPTILFVDSKESELSQKIIGLRSKDDFIKELKLRNF
jgi:thioredoxin-related protein